MPDVGRYRLAPSPWLVPVPVRSACRLPCFTGPEGVLTQLCLSACPYNLCQSLATPAVAQPRVQLLLWLSTSIAAGACILALPTPSAV